MSELLDRLKAKYPRYKVISEPDPECGCKGAGERHVKPSELFPNGRDAPCLCICLTGARRADCVQAFGKVAKKVYDEFKAESQSDRAAEIHRLVTELDAFTELDDAPEKLDGFDNPGGVFKIGGKEVSREEGLAAFREALSKETKGEQG